MLNDVLNLVKDKQQLENQDFIDSRIATKFGDLHIRVYSDSPNKETVVLWTDNLDTSSPVLVRVHSECITGDVFGSLQCDCGKQFSKSLQQIKEEGGLLIYLRQEGRGIGLFEKIKTYQLQSQGYDTFEANIMLGHRPDERTYEMVKVVLNDFNIKNIRLLTNNPSKVSEIAKYGIKIVERIPLLIRPNKHNRRYYAAKQNKFQHSFNQETTLYSYQFQADSLENIPEVLDFVRKQKLDPFLRICVAIQMDTISLHIPEEVAKANSIIAECEKSSALIPVLHFSFKDSTSVTDDINLIRRNFPYVGRIQANDLPKLKIEYLKILSELFTLDIPLCDENFDIVHKKAFRALIKKNKSLVILDNSKGHGIFESKDSLMKKIDTLLSYGHNNIGLAGGFGPDQLERYFELRRFYKINFSIDAETKLKSSGVVDVNKVKRYLHQLIRFDDPKEGGVEQTKEFLKKLRRTEWDSFSIEGHKFLIHSKVFHAGFFPSSQWYGKKVSEIVANCRNFCEIGCGSGVISCLVGLSNPNTQIIATDINPHASENTNLNAEHLCLKDQVEVFQGDVLDSIPKNKSFDFIFWALPFGFLDPGSDVTLEETQVFDPGYRAISKFFQTAREFLSPEGKLLIGFSSDLGHPDLLESLAKQHRIKLRVIDSVIMKETTSVSFELLEGEYF